MSRLCISSVVASFLLCLSSSLTAQISEFRATFDDLKNTWDDEQKAIQRIKDLGGWVVVEDCVPPKWRNEIPAGKRKFVVEVNMVYHEDEGGRLDNKNMSDECLEAIGKFTQVKRIYLKGTQATNEKLKHLANLKQVEHFFVWDAAAVSDAGLKHLSRYRKLNNVHISNGKITSQGIAHLKHCTQLKKLSLQGNGFSNSILEVAARFRHLETLWVGMGDCTIDDEGMKHLPKLKSIKLLGIQGIMATDEGLKYLFKLPKLEKVYVHGNSISREAVKRVELYAEKNKAKAIQDEEAKK